MKVLNLNSCFFLLSFVVVSCVQKTKTEPDAISIKVDSLLHTIPDFSGAILIAEHGKTRYHKAFGFRNMETNIPLDTTDIFELASVSKQFTAMIIMMLEEQGKVNFDDSLSEYIPRLPYPGITVRHLLTHTSGLPDYQTVMDEHWDKSKIATNEDNIKYLIQYHPGIVFQPGTKYQYSNTGYMLLATIAEKASGEDFITLCRNRIFLPLAMTSTDIRTRAEKKQKENFALGYIYVKEKDRYISADSFPEFNYTIWLGDRKGPGRISSTTLDLLKWDQALYTEKLVKQVTLQQAYAAMKLTNDSLSNYGFGWELTKDPAVGRIVFHSGDNPGYKTEIIRYVDAGKTIILLNNNAHERKEEIVSFLRRIVEGKD